MAQDQRVSRLRGPQDSPCHCWGLPHRYQLPGRWACSVPCV